MKTPKRVLVPAGVLVATLAIAGCGGSDNKSSSASSSASSVGIDATKAPAKGKKGGEVNMLAGSDVTNMDPGQVYYTFGNMVGAAIGRTLYAFEPNDAVNAVPDLADGDPVIASDKKSLTVKLRKGIKFGPPVNREIEAKDVKYAMERGFWKNVNNQYSQYYADLVGNPKAGGDKFKEIPGIVVKNKYELEFKLTKPTAGTFAAALVMPLTTPVPREFAYKLDQKNPTRYDDHVVSVGPYMVTNDKEGLLTGWKKGRSIELVRNPNWDASTDFRPAYVDKYMIQINVSDGDIAGRKVLGGKHLLYDATPSNQILKLSVQKYPEQLSFVPGGGWRYFPINTTIKPFDNINVRKAISAAINRDASRKARGGKIIADIPTHYIPPGFPGFEEAGGLKGPGFDFLSNPKGDMALAASYMKKAGYPSGKYTGDDKFLIIAANVDPGRAQAFPLRDAMTALGFQVKFSTVPQDAVYADWCQQPKKKVAVCGTSGWFKDFQDSYTLFSSTFDGRTINPDGGNNNLSQLNDPAVNKLIDEANLKSGEERNKAWAEVDKKITSLAATVPFTWDKQALIGSKDLNLVPNIYTQSWDLSYVSVK